MSDKYQPDFVATIGGTDVTAFLESFDIQDLEDNLSSVTLTMVNDENKFSGKFKDADKVVIRWGYQGDLGGKATFELKKCYENYTTRGCHVIAVGLDPAARLTGASARGTFSENPSVKKCMEEVAEMMDLKIKWGRDPKDPKLPKDFNIEIHNKRLDAAQRYLLSMLSNGKKAGPGASNVGKMGSAKKPIKAQKKPKKKGSFVGTLGNGHQITRSGGMALAQTDWDEANNLMHNLLHQTDQMASSESINARIELKGIPVLKAKKGLTVLGVGSEHSGKWYVKGVSHTWSVDRGYLTRADLLRDSLGKEGTSGDTDRPLVMHGEIYEEDTLYVGERDLNAPSQLTVTFGDGQVVTQFKGGWEVQGSKNAGEGGEVKRTWVDAHIESTETKADTDAATEAGAWGSGW